MPAGERKLVTNHDAFGYYVDRYDLTFVGSIIPSFDTSAELSGQRARPTSSRKIKATGVKAIFSESSLPPKTAEAIGARGRRAGRGRRGRPLRRHARPGGLGRRDVPGAWSGTTPTTIVRGAAVA